VAQTLPGGGGSRWAAARPWLATASRVGLAAVWLYAGVAKAADPGRLLVGVNAYQLLPDWMARATAYGLPFLEIGIGLLLLAGLATRLAAVLSVLLLVVFAAGVSSAAARGLSIDCGCFGAGGQVAAGHTRYGLEIGRDVGLLVLAAFLVLWPASRYAADNVLNRMPGQAVTPPPRRPAAAGRTAAARARTEQLAASRRRQARRRGQVVTAACAAGLVALTGVGLAVQAQRNQTHTAPAAAYTGPVSAAGTDGIVVGYPDAPVTVDLYEDFMCPVCGLFESRTGADLLTLAADHRAKLAYHLLNFLDRLSSGTAYSSRAANAAACAADIGLPFVKLHAALYANQPKENSTGLTDEELVAYGLQAGASRDRFAACVRDRTHLAWTNQMTETAFGQQGVQGTPTVRVGGQDMDWQNGQQIIDAVNRAAGAG
jgi:protein-disulfide isomerase